MKIWLAERRFYSNEEVIAETNAYFTELDTCYYSEGINKAAHRSSTQKNVNQILVSSTLKYGYYTDNNIFGWANKIFWLIKFGWLYQLF